MKILIGSFQCESNTFSSSRATRDNFYIVRGENVTGKLAAARLFEEEGFAVVPMLYAVSLPSGAVDQASYLSILAEFMEIAEENRDADGVYLYFHGAMYVDGIGSGEAYFVKELRKIIGDRVPVSVATDFHANVCDGLIANINALSGYRTAPHTDYEETEYRAARALIRIIREKLDTKLMIFRIPALLADVAQTAKEPYRTLLKMLEIADDVPNIVAAALFNGQPWVDAEYTGVSIVLSYFGDTEYVKKIGSDMADYFNRHKHEFRFEVPALSPDETVLAAADMPKPVFISDSGDNITAGAGGKSTYLLGKILKSSLKKVLVACLCHETAYRELEEVEIGTRRQLKIPPTDRYSGELLLEGYVAGKGTILGFVNESAGRGILFRTENCDIVISNVRTSFITEEHFSAMNLNVSDYDYVVLKMGYLWPRVASLAGSVIFSLSPGTSTNDFSTLEYKNLKYFYYVK